MLPGCHGRVSTTHMGDYIRNTIYTLYHIDVKCASPIAYAKVSITIKNEPIVNRWELCLESTRDDGEKTEFVAKKGNNFGYD